MSRINFILNLKLLDDIESAESFIKDLSVPYTAQCDEPNTISFEWYLNKEKKRALILETFKDSEAAVLRVENLINSPVNEPFRRLFEVIGLTVLGQPNDALKDILESWQPLYLPYIDGFSKS
jgi:hypothetical protein